MSRYYIEYAECGVTDGGCACGPGSGNVITTIKYKDDKNKSQWLSLAEVQGTINFYLTDENIYQRLITEDFEDDKFVDYLEKHYITEFDGLKLGGEYEELYASISSNIDNPAIPLIRYIVALTRCAEDDMKEIVSLGVGKFIDEVNIPEIDIEKELKDNA